MTTTTTSTPAYVSTALLPAVPPPRSVVGWVAWVRTNLFGSVFDSLLTIVGAVIEMGRNLKQRVIAEGIETPAQLDFLRAQHCDEGQGFHFSHPLSAEAFGHLLPRASPV